MAQTALITGAAQRIGRALSLHLARQGWDIVIHYHRSQFEADALATEITRLGQRAFAFAADLNNEAETTQLMEQAFQHMGPIDCLINNASLFMPDNVHSISHETWNAHLNVNTRAPLILSQLFAHQKSSEGSSPISRSIINISDQMAEHPSQNYASYSLSKQLLNSLTTMMARQYAPHVRVNALALGLVLPSAGSSYHDFETLCQKSPLKKATSLEEICEALSLILSSPSMTGSILTLDSGLRLLS